VQGYQTLLNAHNLGLLDKGTEKATFSINSVGENLVAMTLPDEGNSAKNPAKRRNEKKHVKVPRNLAKSKKSKKV
jgi:hypothetical protein